jgi:group I intron endonuclease
MGLIYKVTNLINGKEYVGQTKHTLKRRISHHKWRSKKRSNTHFYNSIKKYGFDNFKFETLEEADNQNLDTREKYYIHKLNTLKNGYNMNDGGRVTEITDDLRKIYSRAQKKRYTRQSERKAMSNLQSKWFIIENIKTKESFITFGLHNFCKKYGLSYACMKKISQGIMHVHRQEWTNVRRI